MTDDDARPGFDRRALIRKGLVAGGIAATVPVITTFNTAAFAASVPGYHRLQFTISAANVLTQQAPDSVTCVPAAAPHTGQWATAQVGLATFTASGPLTGNIYRFTLTGSYSSCEFVDVTAFRPNTCLTVPNANITGVGTNSVDFDRDGLAANNTVTVRLLIFC